MDRATVVLTHERHTTPREYESLATRTGTPCRGPMNGLSIAEITQSRPLLHDGLQPCLLNVLCGLVIGGRNVPWLWAPHVVHDRNLHLAPKFRVDG